MKWRSTTARCSLARLHGSNRAYIEQTIPHISRLMKPSVDSALEDAELIVIAKRSPEYHGAAASVAQTGIE